MLKQCLSLLCALALLLGMTACGSKSSERQIDAAQPAVEERTPTGSVDDLPIPRGGDTAKDETAEPEDSANPEDAAAPENTAKPAEDAAVETQEASAETTSGAEQTETLETPQSSGGGSETASDLEAQIAAIRTQYQNIVFDANLEVRTFGDAATVYLQNGQIVSIAYYSMEDPDAISPKSETAHYYYKDNGAPFFVFIEREGYDGWSELRLYYDGRTLLRWIEDDGAPHDYDQSSDYANYFYEEACVTYANTAPLLSD